MSCNIVIVGAGFSGASLALSLISIGAHVSRRIILVDPAGYAGGLAFSCGAGSHFLNTRVSRMSLFADDPSHFYRFVRKLSPQVRESDFVSRSLFGDYLSELIADRVASKQLVFLNCSVNDLAINKNGHFDIFLSDGTMLVGEKVVLASGHSMPSKIPQADDTISLQANYFSNPWDFDRTCGSGVGERAILVGTGLTAVDSAVSLIKADPARKVVMISRSGRLPLSHANAESNAQKGLPAGCTAGIPVRELLKKLRHEVDRNADAEAWVNMVDRVRPYAQSLWSGWDLHQKKRFHGRLLTFWNKCRHRLPPETNNIITTARSSGNLLVIGGEIKRIVFQDGKFNVTFANRATGKIREVSGTILVNCTGPGRLGSATANPLMNKLLIKGWLSVDRIGIGINVSNQFQPLSGCGNIIPRLYYIGPLLKANFWEATAVPELRLFARELAGIIAYD